ncbi:hypothetical protein H5410_051691 [Solanum commersonii]|uniref:Uncharacterized protein n=1 Tax=Solanum commersonii TaxID=4109 RepID=A0A9J5X1R8_SOLCO|nr:hypothetical protein H5410_051691 [Solanum commersonii]
MKLMLVNIYKIVPVAKKIALLELMRYIDEILSLMRERNLRFHENYDFTDRIMDLNFYTNFKKRYDGISEEPTTTGGRSLKQLLNEFVWDGDIDYVRGIKPYPGDMDWIGAKRHLAAMNMNNTHFVTLEKKLDCIPDDDE